MKSTPPAAAPDAVPGRPEDEALPARQFRTIAELGGDAAFAIALPAHRLDYLSPVFATLSGFGREALQQALDGDGASALAPLAAWLREAAGGQPGDRSRREFDLFDAEGRPLALEALATVPPDDAATLVGLLRDLSEQRAHQSEQKRFASMLNHEFRTPLATIDGAIQRLEATSSHADESTRTRYRKIGAAVDRLIGMLDEYLSPDRMSALGRTRQPNTITVMELVETGATQIRAARREAVLRLDELALGQGNGPHPTLRGEPEGLRLALKVLIDNALAFSPPSAPVILRARRSGGGVELAVLDGGAGVPPDDVSRVFDKGYRGRNAAGMAGSGLGLYMARSIVEVHGGVLSLAPGQEGAGAEFRLWMPALGL